MDERETDTADEGQVQETLRPDARPWEPLPFELHEDVAAYAMVHRQLPRDPAAPPRASLEALGRLDTPFRPVEDVRRLFGPGTYRLTLFTDRHGYVGRAWVTVGEVPASSPAEPPASPYNPNSPAKSAQNGAGEWREHSRPQDDEAPPWARVVLDRLDRLEQRASPGLTMGDLKTVMELVRTMNPPADASLMARSFRQGMALAREVMRSGGGEDSSLGALISQALPAVLQFVQQQQGAAPAAAPAGATPAGGNVTPQWVIPMVQEFNRAITAKDDPGYTASWIERNVPRSVQDELRGPEDAVVGQLKRYTKAIPALGTPEGEAFARSVLRELRGEEDEADADEAGADELAGAGGQE